MTTPAGWEPTPGGPPSPEVGALNRRLLQALGIDPTDVASATIVLTPLEPPRVTLTRWAPMVNLSAIRLVMEHFEIRPRLTEETLLSPPAAREPDDRG